MKVPGLTTHLEDLRSDQRLGCGETYFMGGVMGVIESRGL